MNTEERWERQVHDLKVMSCMQQPPAVALDRSPSWLACTLATREKDPAPRLALVTRGLYS